MRVEGNAEVAAKAVAPVAPRVAAAMAEADEVGMLGVLVAGGAAAAVELAVVGKAAGARARRRS